MSELKLKYKHFRDCKEQGLVDTAVACEIVSTKRFCQPGPWQPVPLRGKTKPGVSAPVSATQAFEAVVTDADGIVSPGLKVAAHHTRCPRVALEKTVFTLFKMEETGAQSRVVQVEAGFPLPKIGPSSLDWPHVHVGRNRDDLPMAANDPPFTLKRVAAEFEQRANVEFKPAISDLDDFELKP